MFRRNRNNFVFAVDKFASWFSHAVVKTFRIDISVLLTVINDDSSIFIIMLKIQDVRNYKWFPVKLADVFIADDLVANCFNVDGAV